MGSSPRSGVVASKLGGIPPAGARLQFPCRQGQTRFCPRKTPPRRGKSIRDQTLECNLAEPPGAEFHRAGRDAAAEFAGQPDDQFYRMEELFHNCD
jgi:hypothetical protein